MSETKALELTATEARQLYHGVEFALIDLRKMRATMVPKYMPLAEFFNREKMLEALLRKTELFALSFHENL